MRDKYKAAQVYVNNAPDQWHVMQRPTDPRSPQFNGTTVAVCASEPIARKIAALLNLADAKTATADPR